MSPAPEARFFAVGQQGRCIDSWLEGNRVMGSKLKDLVQARMQKTGESWQTAIRNVRANAALAKQPGAVAEILRELHASSTFRVLVGRAPATAGGPDLAEVQRQVDELARFPRYYAEAGSVSTTVTLDTHNLLIAAGAADDREVQMIRAYPADGEHAHVFFSAKTFSDQCESCDGWIWCGEQDHEDDCVCGQHYRVSFDGRVDRVLSLRQGMCCIDCGRELRHPMDGANPWRNVNRWQLRCNACHQRIPTTPDQIAALSFRVRRRFKPAA
jgi:hypothetical protein